MWQKKEGQSIGMEKEKGRVTVTDDINMSSYQYLSSLGGKQWLNYGAKFWWRWQWSNYSLWQGWLSQETMFWLVCVSFPPISVRNQGRSLRLSVWCCVAVKQSSHVLTYFFLIGPWNNLSIWFESHLSQKYCLLSLVCALHDHMWSRIKDKV